MPMLFPTSLPPRRAVLLAVALLASSAGLLCAFPEPSPVRKTWEIEIRPQHTFRPIAVRDMLGQTRWYWYLVYKVENNTGSERLFIPEITIATDEGQIVAAGQNVPTGVFEAIAKKERNSLLLSPAEVIGRMLQGPDFAKETVAIWPAFDKSPRTVQVFIAGLSGEIAAIKHPVTGAPVVMTKTLMLTFRTPGSEVKPELQPVVFESEQWVMR